MGLQLVCTLYSLIMKYNTLSFPIPLLLITYVSGEDVSVLLTLQALTWPIIPAISVHASLDVWRRQAIPSASEVRVDIQVWRRVSYSSKVQRSVPAGCHSRPELFQQPGIELQWPCSMHLVRIFCCWDPLLALTLWSRSSVGFVDAAQGCYQCAVSHGTYTVDVANNTLQRELVTYCVHQC